jgi:hypothetical protein
MAGYHDARRGCDLVRPAAARRGCRLGRLCPRTDEHAEADQDHRHEGDSEDPGHHGRNCSLIAFLGGLALLAAALLATGLFSVLSTVVAIVGIAAMIYGLAAGVMIVLNREDDGSPD